MSCQTDWPAKSASAGAAARPLIAAGKVIGAVRRILAGSGPVSRFTSHSVPPAAATTTRATATTRGRRKSGRAGAGSEPCSSLEAGLSVTLISSSVEPDLLVMVLGIAAAHLEPNRYRPGPSGPGR